MGWVLVIWAMPPSQKFKVIDEVTSTMVHEPEEEV